MTHGRMKTSHDTLHSAPPAQMMTVFGILSNFLTNCHNPIFVGTCAGCWPRPPLIRALTNIVTISVLWSSPALRSHTDPLPDCASLHSHASCLRLIWPGSKCQWARVRKWIIIDDDQVWLQQAVQGIISMLSLTFTFTLYTGECWL